MYRPFAGSSPRPAGRPPSHAATQWARLVHGAAAARPADPESEGKAARGPPGSLITHLHTPLNVHPKPQSRLPGARHQLGYLAMSLGLSPEPVLSQVLRTQEVTQSGDESPGLMGE